MRLDSEPHRPHKKGFFGAFNRFYSKTEHGYQNKVLRALRRSGGMLVIYALLCGAMGFAMLKLPGSFLPTEDEGEIMVQYTLPAGATTVRTAEVSRRCANGSSPKANTNVIFTIEGFSFSGSGRTPGWRLSP